MTLRSDQKALLFIGAVAILGAGVRVVRAASGPKASVQPALERQASAADSAARAGQRQGRGTSGAKSRRAKSSGGRESARASRDSGAGPSAARGRRGAGPLDRPGYIAGKLDLDVATAAQIDSLPGLTPAMAKRIVRDRLARGPFVTRDGLRRVNGTGAVFMAKIDSLVTFSGTMRFPDAADTVIPPSRKKKPR